MSWTRHIEDYAIVTLITLLIWLYAESRTLETYPATLSLDLRPPSDDLVITDRSVSTVRVVFTGANSAISELQSTLSGKLQVALQTLEPGRHTLPLADLLPRATKLADANVNITDISPATVEVTVTHLVTRPARLNWQPEGVRLQEGYEIEPDTVQITLPEEKLGEVTEDGKVILEVRPRDDVRSMKAGVELKGVLADVDLPPGLRGLPHVKVVPTSVSLSFIIEKKEVSYSPPSVPVFFTGPPGEQRHFAVDIHEEDQLLKEVQVVGPADLVEQVRSGAVTIKAHFTLDRDGLVRGAQREEAVYPIAFMNVPEGLTVRSPKASVRATIRRAQE